jgi:hypothetical protein
MRGEQIQGAKYRSGYFCALKYPRIFLRPEISADILTPQNSHSGDKLIYHRCGYFEGSKYPRIFQGAKISADISGRKNIRSGILRPESALHA